MFGWTCHPVLLRNLYKVALTVAASLEYVKDAALAE
jgi:hypothetical protein